MRFRAFVGSIMFFAACACGRVGYAKEADSSAADSGHSDAALDARVDAELDSGRIQDGGVDASADSPSDSGTQSDSGSSFDSGTSAVSDARPTGCGDGIVSLAETCDDGNRAPGDGCSTACALEDQGPGGDGCATRRVLTLVPTSATGLGAYATGDLSSVSGGLTCANGTGDGGDVVFAFALSHVSDVSLSLVPSSPSAVFGATDFLVSLRGASGLACTAPAGEVGCADFGGKGVGETLVATALSAGTYFVIVDSFIYPDQDGLFALEIGATPVP
jgi:cysteine-rich repeat protein